VWLRWADTDYRAARLLLLAGILVQGAALSDTAIEKYLKCLFIDRALTVPTHHKVASLYSHIRHVTQSDLDLNHSYLRLIEKAYRLRYPDDIGNGFNIALNQWRLLGELDRSVKKILDRMKITHRETGYNIDLVVERAIRENDEGILANNLSLRPDLVTTLFSTPSHSYDCRKHKGDLYEATYVSASVVDEEDHEREGFAVTGEMQMQVAYLPILDSPNSATQNGLQLKRV
jgi:HEPN domain-containing protein